MQTTPGDDSVRREPDHRRSTKRPILAAAIAVASVTLLGTTTVAGASAAHLAQQGIVRAESQGAHPMAAPVAPRYAAVPTISKVTTGSGDVTSPSLQVTTSSTGIGATYAGGVLTVTWGSANSLVVSGGGPLTPGATIDSINGASITATSGRVCGPIGTIAAVVIDSFELVNGTVRSLALQFGCVTAQLDFAVFGTVGLNVPPSTRAPGYNLYEGDGAVTSFGDGTFLDAFGDLSGTTLNKPVVGMATTPLDGGYWLVAGDGGVFSFGDARFYGSTGNLRLNKPVLGMAATPDAGGYWFVASDGGVFSYGDAHFYGSTGAIHLNKPIVGMAATPDGKGYWLVASDGGIFSFGDARFFGSTGAMHLNQPIVGMAPTPDGNGYWLVAADGGIFTFGDARFRGSAGAIRLNSPIVGMAATADGGGYWITAADGGVFSYGDATFAGSLGDAGVNDVAGMAR